MYKDIFIRLSGKFKALGQSGQQRALNRAKEAAGISGG
jgi:hypothetical protein